MLKFFATALLATLALPTFAMTIKDLQPGKTVSGPSLTVDEMKGKVVIVMYWGTNCPPCLAEMPKLAALYKKYESEGLHIIGLEAQASSDDVTKSTASSRGGVYQITTGGRLNGSTGNTLPHGYLFDSTGAMVEDGVHVTPAFETKIKEMLKDVAGNAAGPGPYKKLANVVAQLKAGMPVGTALKTVSAKVNSKDADEAAEAKLMVDSLRSSGTTSIDRALAMKSEDPAEAVAKLDKVALQYAGDEVGTKAKTESDALKKDPVVKKELEAEVMWRKIQTMNDALKPVRGQKDPKDEAFRKQNLPAISGILAGCNQLNTKYAGTKAAKEAQDLVDEYK